LETIERSGRVPASVAAVVDRLAQERPAVVTLADVDRYVADTGTTRSSRTVLRELVNAGWLTTSGRRGVWAFIPPGEDEVTDPYVSLRAWAATPGVVFALAGESAAWHLGLLARRASGPTSIWIPQGRAIPNALRDGVRLVRLDWGPEMAGRVGPRREWLRGRGLDLTRWSAGLPAFGPEALLVQLGVRPTSFVAWGDLAVNIGRLADACDPSTLLGLFEGQSTPAHQRAAYLLDIGGRAELASEVLGARPTASLSRLTLGDASSGGVWSKTYRITDRLVAPFLAEFGKA
jgi:hypothetical protein